MRPQWPTPLNSPQLLWISASSFLVMPTLMTSKKVMPFKISVIHTAVFKSI